MTHRANIAERTSDPGTRNGSSAERLLVDIIDSLREPLLVLDSDFRITRTNRAFFRMFRVCPEDTVGKVLFDVGDGQWNIPLLRALLSDGLDAKREIYDVDVVHAFPDIGRKTMR